MASGRLSDTISNHVLHVRLMKLIEFVCLSCLPRVLSLSTPLSVFVSFCSGTVISVLEKLLSQSTEQDNPSRLVIEAAHGSASKVRELVQKYPDKVSVALLLCAAVHCLFQELFPPGHQSWGCGLERLVTKSD